MQFLPHRDQDTRMGGADLSGAPIDFRTKPWTPLGEYWEDQSVTLMNLVDLGSNISPEGEEARPTIVLQPEDRYGPGGTNRPPRSREQASWLPATQSA